MVFSFPFKIGKSQQTDINGGHGIEFGDAVFFDGRQHPVQIKGRLNDGGPAAVDGGIHDMDLTEHMVQWQKAQRPIIGIDSARNRRC